MTQFFKDNKNHILGFFLVGIMFVASYFIRQENLSVPMSRHHEWITAHTLITCQIWSENGGPSKFHFAPVYTYPGKGNYTRKLLGGIVDKKGDVYYVSYPPFAFIFAYYTTKLLGEHNEINLRTVILILHCLCACFIYLIGSQVLPKLVKSQISIGGILGAALYIFSSGNLWFHGNLYFADIMYQPIFIISIWFLIRLLKKYTTVNWFHLSCFGLLIFFGVYTEWLGLFFAFFTGVSLLILYFIKKNKNLLKLIVVTTISASLALIMTIYQYSQIDGFKTFKETSELRYSQRSGHGDAESSLGQFNLGNEEAWDYLFDRIYFFYSGVIYILLGIVLVLLLLIFLPGAKLRLERINIPLFVIGIVLISILTHYYLFFNFNSIHEFSSLKTGFLFVLMITIFTSMIQSIISLKANFVFSIIIAVTSVLFCNQSIETYNEYFATTNVQWYKFETGKAIRKNATPETAVFINVSGSPEMIFYAHHNTTFSSDTSNLINLMNKFGNQKGQYYHHSNNKLEYIQEFELQQNKIIYTRKFAYNGALNESSTYHQK